MRRSSLVLVRAAPRRPLREPAVAALLLAALALAALAAAAGPMYAVASADRSLRTVLAAVPDRAPADVSAAVRVSGGKGATRPDRSGMVDRLAAVPGLGPVALTGVSVSPELQSSSTRTVSPLLSAGGEAEAVRLFGTPDPAEHLVVPDADPDDDSDANAVAGGVWLPEPLATRLGAGVGSSLTLTLGDGEDARAVRVPVAGTYAVLDDGRTPRAPDGDVVWSAVDRAGFPRDGLDRAAPAQLVVGDVATVARVGRLLGDDLMWTADARAEGGGSLEAFHETAAGVADLRRAVAILPVGRLGDVLQPLVASGVEDLDEDATALAAAAQRGTALAVRVAVGVGLLLTAAAAVFLLGRRRRELVLVAGEGGNPAVTAGLLVVELLPLAVVAWLLGWWLAGPVVEVVVDGAAVPTGGRDAAVAAAVACLAALACCAAVASLAVVREQRRLRGRRAVAVPWHAGLVVAAVAGVAGLLGRSDRSARTLGVLDLLVPVLVVAAVAAVGARLVWLAVRRLWPTGRTPRAATVARWLAGRRLRAADPLRDATTALAATGLALLVFSLAALSSVEAVVADRSAVAAGAVSRSGLATSWSLDADAARALERPPDMPPEETFPIEDVPVGRTPPLPRGQSVVWHGDGSLVASEVRPRLLLIDPRSFADAADWGSPGGGVARARALLAPLAADADEVAAQVRAGAEPAIPALLVGDPDDPRLEEIRTIGVVETGRLRLTVDVRRTLPGFPGTASGPPTLVLPVDPTFALAGNDDPRLRPPAGSGGLVDRFLPGVFAELWSADAGAAARTLAQHGVVQQPLPGVAQVAADPLFVAGLQARRFQVALGVLFAALGLLAAATTAMHRARRSPAADVMVSWSGGLRGRTADRARAIEVAVELVVVAAVAWVAVQALRPLGGPLVDPGDGRPPASTLVQPGWLALVAAGWWALALVVALAAGRLAARSTTDVEALRGED